MKVFLLTLRFHLRVARGGHESSGGLIENRGEGRPQLIRQ
jgi:hypothetical protein